MVDFMKKYMHILLANPFNSIGDGDVNDGYDDRGGEFLELGLNWSDNNRFIKDTPSSALYF